MTFAEGASVFSASDTDVITIAGVTASAEANIKCTGTGNGGEVDCVQAVAASAQGVATTLVSSFVATTSPIFTISGSQTVPTIGTQPLPTTTSKSAASHVRVSLISVSISGFIGYVILFNIF